MYIFVAIPIKLLIPDNLHSLCIYAFFIDT
jgi:hypothetical protein